MSNVALRSSSTSTDILPVSELRWISFIILISAVSVLWCARKPDRKLSRYPFEFKYLFSWLKTTFSIILLMKGRFYIGLRVLQWQPVKLWGTPCPRGLRQCWKIMVASQNIYTFGPIWKFSLRGVITFVASGLDINGCVLSYFEGTTNLHCYTSCNTFTTLHLSKVSFLQCCHMKRCNKIFTKMWGVYSLLWDTVYILRFISVKTSQSCILVWD